jgi:hypothetical protein
MTEGDFFAPPPFRADDALGGLKKSLRELGLAERAGVFERRGVAIARAAAEGALLRAAVVKRPSRSSPEWQARELKNGAEVRDFVADLKRKLSAWSDRDE